MHHLRIWAISAALLSAVLTPRPAFSCTCVQPPSMDAALDAVDVAFRGTLVKRSGKAAIFRVERVWKGDVGGNFEIEWRVENGDCNGFRREALRIGADLLVFAKRGSGGVYRTNICYPTKPVTEAAEELRALGPGEPPKQ